MLETLAIQNFQIHERRVIEFAPGVTVFWGLNGTGKSGILRAIRLAARNTPASDRYIRRGAKGCIVTLGVDGRLVTRKRGPGVNAYLLDEQEYVSFGQGVPAPVAALLNVTEQNFQRQHDGPFWLGLSPGALARELNAIVDLDVIDRANAAAARGLREAAAAQAAAHIELQAATEEVEKWAWATQAAADYARLGEMEKAVQVAKKKRDSLLKATEAARAAEVRAAGALCYAQACAQVTEAGKAAGKAAAGAASLGATLGALRAAEKEARRPPSTAEMEKWLEQATVAARRADSLRTQVRNVRRAVAEAEWLQADSDEAHAAYHAGVGGACPLCGSSIEGAM